MERFATRGALRDQRRLDTAPVALAVATVPRAKIGVSYPTKMIGGLRLVVKEDAHLQQTVRNGPALQLQCSLFFPTPSPALHADALSLQVLDINDDILTDISSGYEFVEFVLLLVHGPLLIAYSHIELSFS